MTQPGRKARAYLNTGTHAAPTWVEMKNAQDLTVSLGKTRVDLEDRSSDWIKKLAGAKELSISFGYTYRPNVTDAVFTALLDSYVNDTPTELAIMDGDITTQGVQGWRGYTIVFDFNKGEELATAQNYDVTAELTEYVEGGSVVEPDHYVVQ